MPRYMHHIFVCQTARPPDHPKGDCQSKGAAAVLEAFGAGLHAADLLDTARPNAAGCLGACDRGVAVVVYPEGVWYGGVTASDVPEIIASHIQGGTPVQRLRIPEPEL